MGALVRATGPRGGVRSADRTWVDPAGAPALAGLYAALWTVPLGIISIAALPGLERLDPSYLLFLALSGAGTLIAVELPARRSILTMRGPVALAAVWLFGWEACVPVNLLNTVVLFLQRKIDRRRSFVGAGSQTTAISLAGLLFHELGGPFVAGADWRQVALLLAAGLVATAGNGLAVSAGSYLATGDRAHLEGRAFVRHAAFVFVAYVPLSYLMALAWLAGPASQVLTVAIWLMTSLAIKGLLEARQANARLRVALADVHQLSITDPLTGLHNRRHFGEVLDAEVQRHLRYGLQLSLVVIDLRGFKRINDTRGHPAGDEVLRRVGAVIRARLRASDIGFRIGGDEFAVCLPSTDHRGARAVAGSLCREIETAGITDRLAVGATAGVATLPEDAGSSADLVAAADAAMYAARERHAPVGSRS